MILNIWFLDKIKIWSFVFSKRTKWLPVKAPKEGKVRLFLQTWKHGSFNTCFPFPVNLYAGWICPWILNLPSTSSESEKNEIEAEKILYKYLIVRFDDLIDHDSP